MFFKTERGLNWKQIVLFILISIAGLLALRIEAHAAEAATVNVQAAQLTDEHHYYKFTATLSESTVTPDRTVSAVWSVNGGADWTETDLTATTRPDGTVRWNLNVNTPTKSGVDANGLIFEFKASDTEQTVWINNKGSYYTLGGKSPLTLLVKSNVLLTKPSIDAANTLNGSVVIKNIGFRPTVNVLIFTSASATPIKAQLIRKGNVPSSKNTLQRYEYSAPLTIGSTITKIKASYLVNGKTYTDSIPAE